MACCRAPSVYINVDKKRSKYVEVGNLDGVMSKSIKCYAAATLCFWQEGEKEEHKQVRL